jgi:uncharacterized protein (TIGR03435 family)
MRVLLLDDLMASYTNAVKLEPKKDHRPIRIWTAMKTRLILVLALTALAATPRAQVPKDPAFDVAAIKPTADTTVFSYSHVEPGGRYLGQNMSLRLLIKTGYGVHDNQIIGGPSWIDSARWDINAKAEGYKDAMAFRDMSRLMVRPLLADRFKLVMHHELRELPVYAVVVAKPNGELGPKLRRDEHCDPLGKTIAPVEGAAEPSGPMACGADGFNPRHLWARSMTLNYLLIGLRRTTIDRVVVDHTGLSGKFDWEIQWVPEDLSSDVAKRPDGPSIFQAFRDQLGLKLEPTRDRVDVLVIDHVERPTPD